MSDTQGFTLVELMMSITVGTIVLLASFNLITSGTHAAGRITGRVEANQRARPAMQRIMDELHSSCVALGAQPILPGSTASVLQFLSQTGSAASLTPDKHVIGLAGTTLTDASFGATAPAPTYAPPVYDPNAAPVPSWSFATTATYARTLLTGVAGATGGSPSVAVPLFQYYTYVNGLVSSTPLPVPLSASDAAKAAAVTVSFAATPTAASDDTRAGVTMSDTATLRLTAPDEDLSTLDLPCQ